MWRTRVLTWMYKFIISVENVENSVPNVYSILPEFSTNQPFGRTLGPPASTTLTATPTPLHAPMTCAIIFPTANNPTDFRIFSSVDLRHVSIPRSYSLSFSLTFDFLHFSQAAFPTNVSLKFSQNRTEKSAIMVAHRFIEMLMTDNSA